MGLHLLKDLGALSGEYRRMIKSGMFKGGLILGRTTNEDVNCCIILYFVTTLVVLCQSMVLLLELLRLMKNEC